MRPGHWRCQRRSVWSWSLTSPPTLPRWRWLRSPLRSGGRDRIRAPAADRIDFPQSGNVLALDVAGLLQALEKRNDEVLVFIISGFDAEIHDHRQRRLLRPG